MEGKRYTFWLKAMLYLLFMVGAAGHSIPVIDDYFVIITPVFLLICHLAVIMPAGINKSFLIWIAAAYLFSFLAEVFGVKTGLLFGDYVYGKVLGAAIAEVPVIIGLNWVIIVAGSIQLAKKYSLNSIIWPAVITVLFDFLMEPAAIYLKYWTWENNIIPFQNYAAWFSISLLLSFVYQKMKIDYKNDLLIHYLFAQALFFLLLRIIIWV